jgi:fatty-acyl-CoA synthase
MRGLMQDVPLTVEMVLNRARRARTVVTATADGDKTLSWPEIADRAYRLRAALKTLGVQPGDRVATFARNTHQHLELILGIPATGAIVHPLNIRLHRDQLDYIVAEAGDVVLFADTEVAGLTDRVVTLGDEYEALLASVEPDTSPVAVHEDDALALCYTSGTTADPKGVLFSHRSTVLHALGLLMVDSHAIARADVVMPVTGLFHVLGWGLPYAVALAGGDLVLPNHSNAPHDLARLIATYGVTKAAAVPTVWNDFLPLLAERDLPSLRELLIGGAPVPPELIRRYASHGVGVAQGWGMTEMSPSGTMARTEGIGAAMPLVELRLVHPETGAELPWDGEAVGEIRARGPHVARAYFNGDDGWEWLRTGDLARIDPDGTVHLVDRAKDLVKSGASGSARPSSRARSPRTPTCARRRSSRSRTRAGASARSRWSRPTSRSRPRTSARSCATGSPSGGSPSGSSSSTPFRAPRSASTTSGRSGTAIARQPERDPRDRLHVVLAHALADPGPRRARAQLVVDERAAEQDLLRRPPLEDHRRRLQTAHDRHHRVEHDDVGIGGVDRLQGGRHAVRLTDDLDVLDRVVDDRPDQEPHVRVVVDDHDAHRHEPTLLPGRP